MAGPLLTTRQWSTDDLIWGWEGQPPRFQIHPHHKVSVDPTPAYPHDVGLVQAELGKLELVWPEHTHVTFNILPLDGLDGTNAHAMSRMIDGDVIHEVVLYAKRTPIPPGMTRYLVAHEYGHIVQRWVMDTLAFDEYDWDDFLRFYAALRGIPDDVLSATPGMWHLAVAEVFANDFRVMIAEVEPLFWPHPFPRPEAIPALGEWWRARWKAAMAVAGAET